MAQVLAKGGGGGGGEKSASRFLGKGGGGGGGKAGGVIGIDKVAAPSLGDPDAKLPDNFGIAPTGRVTNPLYDVRHVWIHMVVDFKQLPVFFNSLSDSNFMSVLYVRSTDIDEYEHLQSGFVYGNGDCVEVEILVETIWLRDWTSKYMPPKVRTALGVKDVEAAE
jgi:hypothetical protein